MAKIIGREKEVATLKRLYNSDKAQFIAVYGRRRVGKTFLIGELFEGQFAFQHSGLSPYDENHKVSMTDQLQAFWYSLLRAGLDPGTKCPDNWLGAFFLLSQLLEKKARKGKRQIVFIDELPWLDTPKAGFLAAFENFWNGWGCFRDNLMLIVCGSSSSWILDNIINSKGGLYGRLTCEIKLSPFNLNECEEYLESEKIAFSRYDITQAYMAIGGIPYYWSCFERGLSLAQNLDQIFFGKRAKLRNEFDRLCKSLFKNNKDYEAIIRFLARRNYGFTRAEIASGTGLSKGGTLSSMMDNLEKSDFIKKYSLTYPQKEGVYYKLIDEFCLFYLKFVDGRDSTDDHYWQNSQRLPEISSWRGIAFEEVCLRHAHLIKNALGVSGVVSTEYPVIIKGTNDKAIAPIDLLIDRADNVVNLCEMKFYKDEYSVSSEEERHLEQRAGIIQNALPKGKVINMTLVTTYGLKYGEHSGVFQKVVLLDDLFGKER